MKKKERVRLFLERLAQAQPCADHNEAFELITRTLNEIEDEESGVNFNPDAWESDGRLYPPQVDRSADSRKHHSVIKYRSVGHWTLIAANGAFLVEEIKSGKVLLDRVGRDGRNVDDFRFFRG